MKRDRGTLFYSYSPDQGQLSSIVTPANVTLNYTYDSFLLTGVQWKGVVNGNINFIYDNDFRVFRQIINDSYDIYFNYDNDGLLTYAGDMQLTRNPGNGLITGTALGRIKTLTETIGGTTNTFDYSYNT